jgi:AraC-like DNA-binding protein
MDPLSDVLDQIRLRGCVYFQRDFAPPWGMAMDAGPFAQFHLVVRGRCWLTTDDATRQLATGDIVVFPFGTAHALLDDPATAPVPGLTVLQAHQNGLPIFNGQPEGARLLCGHFELDRDLRHPLIKELPSLIHIKGMSVEQPSWLETAIAMLVRESASDQPGAATVVDRLAEVLFVQVLRAHLLATAPSQGFLAALTDRRMSSALEIIHDKAHTDLTLDTIARAAGMSRSNLALRFKEVMGVTPMDYVTGWRMQRAREMLRSTRDSLADVAERVGYRSEAAFSRAFKRVFDQTPGAFRRGMAPAVLGQVKA